MSVCAVLWTHNEPDILGHTLKHLLCEVDEVHVRDRQSGEEARTIIEEIRNQDARLIMDEDDGKYGFDQSAMMTALAQEAFTRGHQWVLPVDPDEVWYANGGSIRDVLAGLSWDTGMAIAALYNHVATTIDDSSKPPFERIGWRQKFPLPLPKVACRLRPDLTILGGNHMARTQGTALQVRGNIVIRHFPYRTPDQFVEKIRSNYEQLKTSGMPEDFGVHVRAYGRCLEEEGEEALRRHFDHWFVSTNPKADDTLTYDPAPVRRPQ